MTQNKTVLLNQRICDLALHIHTKPLLQSLNKIQKELLSRKILFKPVFYLADEWFVLEGQTSIGIPFYLADPTLKKLEKKMMGFVEGASFQECVKILRHEAGHALFYAYRFHRHPEVKKVFGPSPKRIPKTYHPDPQSRDYVRHLDNWYAQAEPDEDFAETFAVWLTPGSQWKSRYKNWPALQKLKLMDRLMKEIAGKKPLNTSAKKTDDISTIKTTLKNYYKKKIIFEKKALKLKPKRIFFI